MSIDLTDFLAKPRRIFMIEELKNYKDWYIIVSTHEHGMNCLYGLVGHDAGLICCCDIPGNRVEIPRSPVRSWLEAFILLLSFSF